MPRMVCLKVSNQQRVNLGRAQEITDRNTVYVMRAEANRALAIAHRQIGVVILTIRNEGHRIDETHGLVEVFKAKRFFKSRIHQTPTQGILAVELAELGDHFGGAERSSWRGGLTQVLAPAAGV